MQECISFVSKEICARYAMRDRDVGMLATRCIDGHKFQTATRSQIRNNCCMLEGDIYEARREAVLSTVS